MRENKRRIATTFSAALAFSVWMNGCIFDSRLPPEISGTVRSENLDTIYPANATPARTVNLFEPMLDLGLSPGQIAAKENYPPVNVKEQATGDVVQYHLSRQRFGSWNSDLEFAWNYFLLQANFLFPEGIPDTTGMGDQTQSIYDKVHLEDLFTNYFDSAAAPAILTRINTSTKAGAVGIAVKRPAGTDTIIIQEVVAGSPAARAGLAVGMAVLAVNDSSVVGDSALERFQRFSVGDSGAAISLMVKGPKSVLTVQMVREPVAFPTVLADSLAANVGYISISSFTPQTVGTKSTWTEFRDALLATRRFPITIIDLRDNGGGSVDIAFRMCDEILPAGNIIIRERQRLFDEGRHAPLTSEVITSSTSGGVGEIAATGGQRKYLLLGNAHSASAAEIFLVSIKEGVKAPLMGTVTYGKGVGQTVRNTPGHGLALVTFLKFTSASGLDYHKHGLQPDYPDSSSADSLLVNATLKAQSLLGSPAAKVSVGADRELAERAAAIEWNRRQAMRRGVVELDPISP